MGKLFGTDGIRGKVNEYPITPEMALKIGQAVAHVLRRNSHTLRVVIGKDTRLSGYMLESALVSGITSMGGEAILIGPLPTPAIAFITNNMDADAGIVISASHNPYEDNGIKIFSKDGFKLSDEQEQAIEELILSDSLSEHLVSSDRVGRAAREEDALGRYLVFLRHTFPKDLSLEGLKIVLDCANGATYKIAPTLFREMRAEVVALNTSPDGRNINLNCGAVSPGLLAAKVVEQEAHIGLAFDGDGDRLIAVDELGNLVNGDKILAVCGRYLKSRNRLKNDLLIYTIMSNLGLSVALERLGIRGFAASVGDRNVLEAMLKQGAVLGGEDSGHLIFLDHHTTGDGILSALQLLAVMIHEEKSLSSLAAVMDTFPQITINVPVKKKPDLSAVPEISRIIQTVEESLGDQGRVLVRYSGTQPLCRVMVEGPAEDVIASHASAIAEVVKAKLNE
jgi:phosphoglucosamine mutase